MKVQNMTSPNGNKVPNQFIVDCDEGIYFQSYNSIIAKKAYGRVFLDSVYWDYSVTTSKYRNQFLGEDKKTTQKKIESGEYVLKDLNNA